MRVLLLLYSAALVIADFGSRWVVERNEFMNKRKASISNPFFFSSIYREKKRTMIVTIYENVVLVLKNKYRLGTLDATFLSALIYN